MKFILRIIGAVWILITGGEALGILRNVINHGIHLNFGLDSILSVIMLVGGIGLLFLKEWARWVLLLGAGTFLILLTGPSLLHFKIGPVVIRHMVFYGFFIALLLLPKAKSVTKK